MRRCSFIIAIVCCLDIVDSLKKLIILTLHIRGVGHAFPWDKFTLVLDESKRGLLSETAKSGVIVLLLVLSHGKIFTSFSICITGSDLHCILILHLNVSLVDHDLWRASLLRSTIFLYILILIR